MCSHHERDDSVRTEKGVRGSTAHTAPERILAVVIELLESGGFDAVQLGLVANRARVSMTTIYKNFGSRDELIVAAMKDWMESHVYRPLTGPFPQDLYEAVMWHYRCIYGPWEQNPLMADAFFRARMSPGGHVLELQGYRAVEPIWRQLTEDADPDFVADVRMITTHVVHSLLYSFAAGEIEVTEIIPTLERTLRRLIGKQDDLMAVQRSSVARGRRGGSLPKTTSRQRARSPVPSSSSP
jgi:AcrR family transcriptional regulator